LDFSDGGSVEEQRERLRNGRSLDPELLGNAFSRPLSALAPTVAELPSLMHRHGAPNVSLSGAGPAHYVVLDDPEKAARLARTLDGALGSWARVVAVPTHATGPRIIVETA
jgi:4-diphosphocytidyl-2C-methyl-D-erythritol kinase